MSVVRIDGLGQFCLNGRSNVTTPSVSYNANTQNAFSGSGAISHYWWIEICLADNAQLAPILRRIKAYCVDHSYALYVLTEP